jgi:hypothetical protein
VFYVALVCGVSGDAWAEETAEQGAANRALSFIPYIRNNPCKEPYRQLAVSPPLKGTNDGGEGFPWRALYGYCVAQTGRLTLHQDWVVSYLDVEPKGDLEGGDGVSFGTDFSFLWQHRAGNSFTPYYELGGGIQYAAGTAFPVDGSRWMFTINAGAGFFIPVQSNRQLNLAIRYLHISNAGVWSNNEGYDALHLLIGLRWGF